MKLNLEYFTKKTEGSVVVEFALIAPILFLMIFGLIECGRAYFIRSNLQYAAGEAGRYAMVYKTASDTTITAQVTQHLVAVDPTDVTVTIQTQTINGQPFKQIAIAYNFTSVVSGLLPWGNIPLNVQSSVPVIP